MPVPWGRKPLFEPHIEHYQHLDDPEEDIEESYPAAELDGEKISREQFLNGVENPVQEDCGERGEGGRRREAAPGPEEYYR
ncbi:MAG: hypothetical protein WBK48_07005 [Dethiobacteria bacterium]|nr:hypothetical protein [Bacillota bacterium]HOP69578.1 hypothetical protein [Bacillota bacterium]HPT34507.1 hypothetical protein [Bacillota bacterium]HPZ65408.1 hypothetical protein [Bacillota bacterium]HQD06344.1 hypothetical protein [Bacillota bacterium]